MNSTTNYADIARLARCVMFAITDLDAKGSGLMEVGPWKTRPWKAEFTEALAAFGIRVEQPPSSRKKVRP